LKFGFKYVVVYLISFKQVVLLLIFKCYFGHLSFRDCLLSLEMEKDGNACLMWIKPSCILGKDHDFASY